MRAGVRGMRSGRSVRGARGLIGVRGARGMRDARGATHLMKLSLPDIWICVLLSIAFAILLDYYRPHP